MAHGCALSCARAPGADEPPQLLPPLEPDAPVELAQGAVVGAAGDPGTSRGAPPRAAAVAATGWTALADGVVPRKVAESVSVVVDTGTVEAGTVDGGGPFATVTPDSAAKNNMADGIGAGFTANRAEDGTPAGPGWAGAVVSIALTGPTTGSSTGGKTPATEFTTGATAWRGGAVICCTAGTRVCRTGARGVTMVCTTGARGVTMVCTTGARGVTMVCTTGAGGAAGCCAGGWCTTGANGATTCCTTGGSGVSTAPSSDDTPLTNGGGGGGAGVFAEALPESANQPTIAKPSTANVRAAATAIRARNVLLCSSCTASPPLIPERDEAITVSRDLSRSLSRPSPSRTGRTSTPSCPSPHGPPLSLPPPLADSSAADPAGSNQRRLCASCRNAVRAWRPSGRRWR